MHFISDMPSTLAARQRTEGLLVPFIAAICEQHRLRKEETVARPSPNHSFIAGYVLYS